MRAEQQRQRQASTLRAVLGAALATFVVCYLLFRTPSPPPSVHHALAVCHLQGRAQGTIELTEVGVCLRVVFACCAWICWRLWRVLCVTALSHRFFL